VLWHVPICAICSAIADLAGKWVPTADVIVSLPVRTKLSTDRFGAGCLRRKGRRCGAHAPIRSRVTSNQFDLRSVESLIEQILAPLVVALGEQAHQVTAGM